MNKTILVSSIISTLFFSASGFCEFPDISPGLWEHKVDISSQSGAAEAAMAQAQQMLDNLPPDQQAMVKEMMAKQGIGLGLKGRTYQVCLTKADIEQGKLPKADDECQQNITKQSSNTYKMTMQCSGNPPTKGEGTFIVKNDKSFSGKIIMNVNVNGQADTMTMTQEGRWLKNDCGQLAKP